MPALSFFINERLTSDFSPVKSGIVSDSSVLRDEHHVAAQIALRN
jgi:hypothetical protein